MNCAIANERLLELVYDELTSPDHVELLGHVEQCRRCSEELAALRRTRDALDRWPAPSRQEASRMSTARTFRPFGAALTGAAAMLAICVGGVAVFGTVERGPSGLLVSVPWAATSPVGDEYLLLLHSESTESAALSESSEQERVAEYGAWAHELSRQGALVSAEKLDDRDVRWLGRTDVPNGDDAEVACKERIGGYFLIRADSMQRAAQVAAESPHLKYGGTIELRRIEKTN